METTSGTRQQTEVTVITVDDHAVFRQVAHDVIAATPGFEPVGEAESGEDALRLVGEIVPELILLDVRIPEWTVSRPPVSSPAHGQSPRSS